MSTPAAPLHLDRATLRPYASIIILQITLADYSAVFGHLLSFLRRSATNARRGSAVIVASGFDGFDQQRSDDQQLDGFDEADAFVSRRTSLPSWIKGDSTFSDVHHDLTVAL